MDSNNPYTGKRITLISNSLIRYEGTLISVNPDDATVGLAKVRIFGTEERAAPNFVPPSNSVFESVLFRGTDIREIALINEEPAPFVDPAVLEIHQPSASQPAAAAAPSSFTQPSVFPSAASASHREPSGSGGTQSSGTFAHLTSTISPRGGQPSSFGGNQNQSTASSAAPGERSAPDRDADRFSSRQANASQRPPFANATNTASAGAVAPPSRGTNESSKRTDAQSSLGKSQQPAPATKPATWAGVVTSAPKARRGSSSSNSLNEFEANGGRPRDEQRGRSQRGGAPQEQRAAGSARGGEYSSQRGGRTSFLDRDRPTYNYAPRGGATSWSRGGGGGGGGGDRDREEFGGRRQGGLVGRGGANDYTPQSAGQRGGFGFGFGFNAQQNSRGGYGHREAYSAGPARGQSWTRGGGARDATRSDWRAPGPRGGADSRKAGGVPAEYQEEFDFESGNTQLAHELEKLHLDGQGPKDGEGVKAIVKDERGDAEAADLGNASGSDDEGSTQDSESHYDKRKSFFDSISSEVSATNKKPNWHKERQVNAETFGQAALRRGGGGRGGRGRGGWRGPRRGGYGYNNY